MHILTHTHTHKLTHSLTHTHTHSLTHSLTHSHTHRRRTATGPNARFMTKAVSGLQSRISGRVSGGRPLVADAIVAKVWPSLSCSYAVLTSRDLASIAPPAALRLGKSVRVGGCRRAMEGRCGGGCGGVSVGRVKSAPRETVAACLVGHLSLRRHAHLRGRWTPRPQARGKALHSRQTQQPLQCTRAGPGGILRPCRLKRRLWRRSPPSTASPSGSSSRAAASDASVRHLCSVLVTLVTPAPAPAWDPGAASSQGCKSGCVRVKGVDVAGPCALSDTPPPRCRPSRRASISSTASRGRGVVGS